MKREDLLDRIKDLHKQARKEKSHYYVASILEECFTEISCLRFKMDLIKDAVNNLTVHKKAGE